MNRFFLVSVMWLGVGAAAVVAANKLAEDTSHDLERLNRARLEQVCKAAGVELSGCDLL